MPAGRTLILRIPGMQTANFLIKVVISRNRTDYSVFNRSTSEMEERGVGNFSHRSYLRRVVETFDRALSIDSKDGFTLICPDISCQPTKQPKLRKAQRTIHVTYRTFEPRNNHTLRIDRQHSDVGKKSPPLPAKYFRSINSAINRSSPEQRCVSSP